MALEERLFLNIFRWSDSVCLEMRKGYGNLDGLLYLGCVFPWKAERNSHPI